MFLPSMNGVEIIKAIDNDRPMLRRKASHFAKNIRKNYISSVRNFGMTMLTTTEYYKIPSTGSEYIICLLTCNRKQAINGDSYRLYYPMYRDNGRIWLVSTVFGSNVVVRFTPHFFDRYKERMTGIVDGIENLDRIKLIETYIVRNANVGEHAVDKIRNGVKEYEMHIGDGAMMLNWDSDKREFIAKTFINDDMMYKEQADRVTNVKLFNPDSIERMTKVNDILNWFN